MSINPAKWGQCINILIHTGRFAYEEIYTDEFMNECTRLYDHLTSVELKMKEKEQQSVDAKINDYKKNNKVFEL